MVLFMFFKVRKEKDNVPGLVLGWKRNRQWVKNKGWLVRGRRKHLCYDEAKAKDARLVSLCMDIWEREMQSETREFGWKSWTKKKLCVFCVWFDLVIGSVFCSVSGNDVNWCWSFAFELQTCGYKDRVRWMDKWEVAYDKVVGFSQIISLIIINHFSYVHFGFEVHFGIK